MDDTSGPDGTWYLNVSPSTGELRQNNQLAKGDAEPRRRCTATFRGGFGWLLSGAGALDFLDNVTWDPVSRVLEFRRVGATFWEWHSGRIVRGVYVGRFSHSTDSPWKPLRRNTPWKPLQRNTRDVDWTRYREFASGWSSTYLDTELVPRVYDVLIGDSHGRLRLDREAEGSDTHVGRLKIYRGHGPYGGEELEHDVEVVAWDGFYLEFLRHGDTPDTSDNIVETYRATSSGRMLVGTVDIAGKKPRTINWKGARAEVLTHGVTPRSAQDLTAWQERTRAQIQHIIMAGNPTPRNAQQVNGLSVVTPDFGKPAKPSKGRAPVCRDDDPNNRNQAYSRTGLKFHLEIPNPYRTGPIRQTLDAVITLPYGDPVDHLPKEKFPAIIVLAGHHGGAWSSLQPCDVWYWYGDGFARNGYVVLAVNVGHRNATVTNRFYVDSDYAKESASTSSYKCDNSFDGDGPGNPPHPAIAAPHMNHSDWADDGERTWKVLQAFAWLRTQPYVDENCIFVTGLSMGGWIAAYAGALEPGFAAVVAAGCSTDMGQNVSTADDSDPHRCSFWDMADQREYTDVSDLYALVSPRTLVVQTGKYDQTFSKLRVRVGKRVVDAYFAVDKQVARRSRAAYAISPHSFVHYLHYDAHRYHFGVIATKQPESVPFVMKPSMTEPPPGRPWSIDWQYDAHYNRERTVLFDYLNCAAQPPRSRGPR